MGTEIFDPTEALKVAGDVALRLEREPDKRVAVEGPPGSGRTTLVDRLAEKLGGSAVVVRVPPSHDADVPLHALLQAARAKVALLPVATRGNASFEERAREVLGHLASAGVTLVLHLPDDIRTRAGDDEATRRWVDILVKAAVESDGLAFALVAPKEVLSSRHVSVSFGHLALRPPFASHHVLDDAAEWGTFAGAAGKLALDARNHGPFGPIQLRLMVGLVGLGVPASEVVRRVRGTTTTDVDHLVRLYATLLNAPEREALRRAVRRFLLARSSLPRETALEIAVAPEGTEPLFTACLGYGAPSLRVPPAVRTPLLALLHPDLADEEEAHERIARFHASLDGASTPEDAAAGSAATLVHWLEKVHHLAHSGPRGKAEWESQKLESREFLVDRARSLSMVSRDYAGAAALYARCTKLWEKDAYAFHYRGYNLDRLGEDPAEVERCYRKALEHDRGNLFYNSRLVTFFVERARYGEAERAFERALENLEGRDPREVFWHTTSHVVQAWLEAGEVRRARDAFDTAPPDVLDEQAQRLRQRLEDAEEAERLGFAAYPADVPMAKRWTGPRLAQPEYEGRALQGWYPGRVALAEDEPNEVVVTWVVPREGRVLSKAYSLSEWCAFGGRVPGEAPLFVELAAYVGLERWVVFTDPQPSAAEPSRSDDRHPLRYLMGRKIEGSIVG